MTAASRNRPVFDFLRRRYENVAVHAQRDEIETYILWGAATETLMRIHARRIGRSTKKSRAFFVAGLIDLEPLMSVISVPLLAEDAKPSAPDLLLHAPLSTYRDARRVSRLWQLREDVAAHHALVALRGQHLSDDTRKLFDRNRYAEIVYGEYRCACVHGLELGPRAESWQIHDEHDISYSNWLNNYPTRITFSKRYLCELLWRLIHTVEQQCSEENWTIPPVSELLA